MNTDSNLRELRDVDTHFKRLSISTEMEINSTRHKQQLKKIRLLEKMAVGDSTSKHINKIQTFVRKKKMTTSRRKKKIFYESRGVQTICTDLQDSKQEEMSESFFYQLVAFIVEITPDVVRRYFDCFVLQGKSFEEYLETNKHILFHIYETLRCCQCGSFPLKLSRPNLTKTQFLVLYRRESTRHNSSHIRTQNGHTKQVCLCSWIARPTVTTNVLDISLAHIILKNCTNFQLGADTWMKKITEIRNEIFHKSDIKALTKKEFVDFWQSLSGSITGLANLISHEYNMEMQYRIDMLKGRVMVSRDKWKLEHLCLDYWKQKSAELEANRTEEVKAFQLLLNGISESDRQTNLVGRKLKNVMTKIEKLSSMVDDVSVNVFGNVDILQIMNQKDLDSSKGHDVIPVLMQLKVPSAWDWAKIEESIENIRTKMTSLLAPNIQIRTCLNNNLTFLTEILRNLIANKRLLQKELYDLMNWLLKESGTDTKTCASVDILLSAHTFCVGSLPAEFILKVKRPVFEDTRSRIADCLETQNGEIVFLVKTEYDTCKIYIFNEHLVQVQEESAPIGSRNLMTCGENALAILGTGRLTVIQICSCIRTAVIPLPADDIPVTSYSDKTFLLYTNNTLLFIDCKGRSIGNISISVERCYLLHASNEFLYFFCHDNRLSVCTMEGLEIQGTTFPERVCSCTTVLDGGLLAVCNSSSVFYISADGSDWSLMQSRFEPMTSIQVVCFCNQTKSLLFCHGCNYVSVYFYDK